MSSRKDLESPFVKCSGTDPSTLRDATLEAALRELSDDELAELLVCIVGEPPSGKSGVMAANFGDGAATPPDEGSEAGTDNPHGQET